MCSWWFARAGGTKWAGNERVWGYWNRFIAWACPWLGSLCENPLRQPADDAKTARPNIHLLSVAACMCRISRGVFLSRSRGSCQSDVFSFFVPCQSRPRALPPPSFTDPLDACVG